MNDPSRTRLHTRHGTKRIGVHTPFVSFCGIDRTARVSATFSISHGSSASAKQPHTVSSRPFAFTLLTPSETGGFQGQDYSFQSGRFGTKVTRAASSKQSGETITVQLIWTPANPQSEAPSHKHVARAREAAL
jgi:hypothetical protein